MIAATPVESAMANINYRTCYKNNLSRWILEYLRIPFWKANKLGNKEGPLD